MSDRIDYHVYSLRANTIDCDEGTTVHKLARILAGNGLDISEADIGVIRDHRLLTGDRIGNFVLRDGDKVCFETRSIVARKPVECRCPGERKDTGDGTLFDKNGVSVRFADGVLTIRIQK